MSDSHYRADPNHTVLTQMIYIYVVFSKAVPATTYKLCNQASPVHLGLVQLGSMCEKGIGGKLSVDFVCKMFLMFSELQFELKEGSMVP